LRDIARRSKRGSKELIDVIASAIHVPTRRGSTRTVETLASRRFSCAGDRLRPGDPA
jgi:hypothetical protein